MGFRPWGSPHVKPQHPPPHEKSENFTKSGWCPRIEPIFCGVKATYLRGILGDSWDLGPGFRGLPGEILEEILGKFWKIWGVTPHDAKIQGMDGGRGN